MECVRSDRIIHSTVIDKPMFEQLPGVDLVIADLSPSSENAIYNPGVRHTLPPRGTIVMAESYLRKHERCFFGWIKGHKPPRVVAGRQGPQGMEMIREDHPGVDGEGHSRRTR